MIPQESEKRREIRSRICLMFSDLRVDFYFPFHTTEHLSIAKIYSIGGAYVGRLLNDLGIVSPTNIGIDYSHEDSEKPMPYLETRFLNVLKNKKTPYEVLNLALSDRDVVSDMLKSPHKHKSGIEFIPANSPPPISQDEIKILSENFDDIVFLNKQPIQHISKSRYF